MGEKSNGQESVLNWLIIGVTAFCGLLGLFWLVGSHYIVYYGTPVVHAIAFPWFLLPKSVSGVTVNDLDMTYELYRQYPNRIGFIDWMSYLNTAFKPWLVVFFAIYAALFMRQIKKMKTLRQVKLTPLSFAQKMVHSFPEIAPVVCIQKEIVANKFKEWRRQTFPDELIRTAQTPQKRPVLVIDSSNSENSKNTAFARKSDAERSLKVDSARLAEHLQHVQQIKKNGLVRTHNRYLGFQITNLAIDMVKTKGAQTENSIVGPDRLSDAGKAIFAILAPYAFGGASGKSQSKEVKDALNRSAYGTEKGFANLSLPIVQASFNKWRTHQQALNLAKIHHWEHTYLVALLFKARTQGKLTTGSFIWLRPMARVLFWALDDAGRKTPSAEGALTFSQFQFEIECIRELAP